jgi:three-Cys-motif partner protein
MKPVPNPSPDVELDEIGYWSELKLDIIRDYAQAYSRILANQSTIKGHVYVDAFAGAGIHVSKTTGEFVLGSPLNALHIKPSFSEIHLIDLQASRTAHLRKLTEGESHVTVHDGDCNDVLLGQVFPKIRYEDYKRGLCLLDPYGLHLKWEVMAQAGKMKSLEIFLNFPIADMNRNVLRHNQSKVTPDQAARLTAFWGDESWKTAAYYGERDLFGEEREEKNTNEAVVNAFKKRLKDAAGFKHVPDPLPMKNTRGAVVYYLFFSSQNDTGLKIVSEIFSKYRNCSV